MTNEKRLSYLYKKRDVILQKVHHYNNIQADVFRLKNYSSHIKRNITILQEINEEIYKLTGLDKNKIAL